MTKPGAAARSWDRFVQYMNERPEPQPLTAEERDAAADRLQRTAGFTPEETDRLTDDVLVQVKSMISTPPKWQTDVWVIVTVLVILVAVQALWQVLGAPGPSIIASAIGAIVATLYVRRQLLRPRFAGAHEAFGDAGMRLMRAVGKNGRDQSVLKRNAMRAATDWRRLGPTVGVNVTDQIGRVLQMVGYDRTLPLPTDERHEIAAAVRATLVQAAGHAAQS